MTYIENRILFANLAKIVQIDSHSCLQTTPISFPISLHALRSLDCVSMAIFFPECKLVLTVHFR